MPGSRLRLALRPSSIAVAIAALAACASAPSAAAARPFLKSLHSVSTLASTVPANGDVNPYGIALVKRSFGKLDAGSLLVSNFNDKANNQGTGTTIVEISRSGKRTVFARLRAHKLHGRCPGGVGLTTALTVLPHGYVVVGSLPTTNGKSATARFGCLIIVNSAGHAVGTIAGGQVQGPWDMTSVTQGSQTTLFVSMVLNGGAAKGVHTLKNSTVLRITLATGGSGTPTVLAQQVVANGIPWRDDPAALVIGPTGVALAQDGTLYIADTLQNRISAVPQALTRTSPAAGGGTTVARGKHLKQPLGLTLAPNGDILTTNAGDGKVVETAPSGRQVFTRVLDRKTGAGSLFGLLVAPSGHGLYYVDDGDNTVKALR